ncbi:hypothetical protein HYU96_01430 [Candidatus Daviesbacteria bacterium]|nr:hypothetical protein [Candidatus Daviesbacteria bacterium]
MTKKTKPILQIVAMPRPRLRKTNGKHNGWDRNGRSFETRFMPRYKKIPSMPKELPTPTFSESSNKILQERYLLKGGNLEVVETVAERFWHIAYDIASGDFDFGATPNNVEEIAKHFYTMMVRQEFLPNSPTIMNAGKQNGLQYSACFVLPVGDSLPEIFDSVKYAALIHQTGGGCISSDARVWTTFCGIEPIEVLVSRAIADDRTGTREGQGVAFDVSDLNIKTVAMNPASGEVGLKNVTHVWQFDVPVDQQLIVTTYQGTKVQTSLWHPFLVLKGTGLVETRADQLRKGDILFGPDQASTYWPWQKLNSVDSMTVDEDLGWLIGFTLGDGSFGYVPALRQYRVRWFSGTEDVLKKVQAILLKRDMKISIQKDKRGLLSIATLNQRFVHDLLEACGLEKFGPKDNLIRVPEIITKSPLPVVRAFIAGLLDSDGYVAIDGSPSYCSVSEAMIQDLASLLSLLGFHPSVKSKEAYGKGKQKTYSVQLCTLPQVNYLADELKPYLSNCLRLARLKSESRKQTALPLEFRSWRDLLFDLGLVKKRFHKRGSGPLAYELNYWSAHGRIDRDSILAISEKVASVDIKTAQFLRRTALSGQEVKEVQNAPTPKKFYDLSVADWNTYAAGQGGMVMIHNTGFAFSRLRPSGSIVRTTGGVASGPVSFLRVFNAATESIKQGGTRRGANMGILRVDHPDILDFIRSKAELDDLNKPVYEGIAPLLPDDSARGYLKTLLLDKQIANFNISVAATDRFMEAVAKGEDYELVAPHNGEAVGKLNAKQVFDEIVERAWHTGDPGLIFIDRINNSPANPVPKLETIESTNPCVTGDTLVSTENGWKRADEIKTGERISTILGSGLVDAIEVYNSRPVYRVRFSDGAEVRATAAHQFHAIVHEDRTKNSANKKFTALRLDQLKAGDMVRVASALMPDRPVFDLPKGWSEKEYGFFVGVLIGDGCITETSIKRNVVKVAINTSEKEWNEIIRNILKKAGSKFVSLDASKGLSANFTVQNSSGAALLVKQSYLKPAYSYEKRIPIEYQQTNREFLKGILDGLFSTDGNVNLTSTHPFLRLKTTSKQLALDIRRILLCFGIHGRVVTIGLVKDGHIGERIIVSKHQQYEVIISGASMKTFVEQIGLTHPQKQQRLQEARLKFSLTGNTWLTQIISIEADGIEKVYDLHEPISDTWITEGIVSRGCGEQPLAPWDACNLGSINLGKFYEEVHKNRRIGLGVMGFADMLFKLKIPYNSQKALEMGERVMKFINEEGHAKSEELALGRGPFPSWAHSIYAKDKPIRNSTVTTIAPTGTISIIGDCSSGIEPVFALAYIHKAKGAGDNMRLLTIANQTFEDIARKEGFYSDDLAKKVLDRGSVKGLQEVPDSWQEVFVTAPEISPERHVKMQAAFQKYTDNGVSKTINLPNSATVEDVKTAYLLAWQTGCNGITIYRDGSKSTQVLNVSSTLQPAPVAGRPMILRGRTYKISTPVGEAFITVNRNEHDQPFEVFVTVGKGGMHTMADAEAMGRLVSLSLRLGRNGGAVDPKEVASKIISQLKGIGGASSVGFGKNRVLSLADAIAKVLSEDLALNGVSKGEIEQVPLNLTTSTNVDLCPECGSASFVMEEGCKKCHSCGYSLC